MIFNQSPFQTANEILQKLDYTKTAELAEKISLAAEIFANASGYCILPCPKWEAKAKAYSLTESRNYISMFTAEVAADIRAFEFYKDGPGAWLKAIHKEWIADQARERMLVSFDNAYQKWQQRKNVSKEEKLKRQRTAVERYNKVFRENPGFSHGVFFADQLENICS